ncbi:MAG: NAD(P)H-dependent oxidoreductase subunit E [Myxococcales bacterium]|jgi:[NiFe] hydrogenase diaphorase moiety large subunit
MNLQQVVPEAAARCGRDPSRIMDVVREIQARFGRVSDEAIHLIASELKVPPVDVKGVVTFYAFLSREQKGRTVIRLSECIGCLGATGHESAEELQKQLGIKFGETTSDGAITLERTACIGMCDQGPAALVNKVPVAKLTPERVTDLIAAVRGEKLPEAGFAPVDNVHNKGEVVFAPMELGAGLKHALALDPAGVIGEVKASRLRGRGGAGFPAGTKWEFCARAQGERKVVICNADEGEPGTFKDREILKQVPAHVFEGMAIAGYAIGAKEGILYLRGEYAYMLPALEKTLEQMREKGVLGKGLGDGKHDFDIRIQLGAGAYVCGEESALISSCEGGRGVPKDRPPFPVERGYLGLPTVVNNVETFAAVARILEKGAGWFASHGTRDSTGTKLLSVSGDCQRPGVYELPYGTTVRELLAMVGGDEAQAVLVGGPSGNFVKPADFDRKIGYEALATGGSVMVFGPKRDLLEVVSGFMHFFVDESCGHCVPCRVGNVLIKERLDKIRAGHGVAEDLGYLEELCTTVKKMSRCGLGQSSPNPVATTLAHFRELYEKRLTQSNGLQPDFDLNAALQAAVQAQGRAPVFHED